MSNRLVRLIVVLLFIVIASGCGTARKVEQCDNQGSNCKTYTYLANPEDILNTFAYDGSISALIKANIPNKADLQGNVELINKLTSLAEKYDQNNIQTISLAKAAIIGLNMNPSEKYNNDNFWFTPESVTHLRSKV
jgi:hypothetical protein